MLKKVFGLVLTLILLTGGSGFATPETVTGTQVFLVGGVNVTYTLELKYWIRSVPSTSTNPYGPGTAEVTQSGLNFGPLVWNPTYNVFMADKYFAVFFIPTSGRPYRLTQSCTGIVNGVNNLNNSLIMTPDYVTTDAWDGGTPQDIHPSVDYLGGKDLAVGADKLIYNAPSSEARIIRCYYGIATGNNVSVGGTEPAASVPVTSDTASGTYSGTITFTLTAY